MHMFRISKVEDSASCKDSCYEGKAFMNTGTAVTAAIPELQYEKSCQDAEEDISEPDYE